jgi:hypothetical protein
VIAAANRLLEAERQRVVQIRAPLRGGFATGFIALAEHVGEQVAERGRVSAVRADREIEALEPDCEARIRPAGQSRRVVLLPAIGIAQRLVCFGNLPELRGGHPVARIDVRVKLARQSFVGALDVAQRGAALQSEDDVEIHSSDFRIQSSDLFQNSI